MEGVTEPQTIAKILEIFNEKLSRAVGSPDEDLFESGALDSMALVELLLELEMSLGISISIADLDIDRVRTVRGIAELAEVYKAAKNTAVS